MKFCDLFREIVHNLEDSARLAPYAPLIAKMFVNLPSVNYEDKDLEILTKLE